MRVRKARGAQGRRERNACQETIAFRFFYQANAKILIGQSSKHVNHNLNTLTRLVETCSSFLNSADPTFGAWNTVEARLLWEYW